MCRKHLRPGGHTAEALAMVQLYHAILRLEPLSLNWHILLSGLDENFIKLDSLLLVLLSLLLHLGFVQCDLFTTKIVMFLRLIKINYKD